VILLAILVGILILSPFGVCPRLKALAETIEARSLAGNVIVCGWVVLAGAIVGDPNLKNSVAAGVCDKCAQENVTWPLRTGWAALEDHLLLESLRKLLKCSAKLGELAALRVGVLPRGVALVLDEDLDVWRVVFAVVIVVVVDPKSHRSALLANVV